jgi:Uma2 family endonuclease
MAAGMGIGRKNWTEEDLQSLPDDGYIYEVVNGELVMSPKNDFFHGDICSELLTVLRTYVREKHLGTVLDSSTGFWMKNRNCRAPDISFISRERLIAHGFKRSTRSFFPGAPDLAVEILSPNNTRAEMEGRLTDFFESGTRLVWIIDPEFRRAEIIRGTSARKLIGTGSFLDGEDILPGFLYPLDNLFKAGDWE